MHTVAPRSVDSLALTPPAKIALVGAGAFGRFALDAYARSTDIIVDVVVDPVATNPVPGVRLERDLAYVLGNERIEALHLVTPPHVRAELAVPALLAGKSVFCEKPLAISLADVDAMWQAAEYGGAALGVDHVLRHHDAFHLLETLAASKPFGRLKTFSLQNFAQSLPQNHWMWDRKRSGGIFVEHGVHFFDSYGRIAGAPEAVRAGMPKREAAEATVNYADGVVGRYFHEFAFPKQVEKATGTVFFERGYIEIDGWIPERLHGAVLAPADALQHVARMTGTDLSVQAEETTRFQVSYADRNSSYARLVVSGMRDLLMRHRSAAHEMVVRVDEARASVRLALAAEESARIGSPVSLAVSTGT
ncbi:MAG: hypothetical protein PVSMB7_13220 [Chloroflexota bacterium]